MIRAIFFDVDGTLLSHITRRIPHDTEQILMRLKEHGIKIFMSTGRHPAELLKLPVNNIKFDGYITLNGQLCLDDMGHIVFGTPFNKEITDKLVATVYKGNIIKNLIMDCQSYTKYRPNETTGGIFVSWRRKEELPTGA